MEMQRPKVGLQVKLCKRRIKLKDFTLPPKTYKTTEVKAVWYWHKSRQINGTKQKPKIDTPICDQWILRKIQS